MGSPVSVVAAEIVMQEMEHRIFNGQDQDLFLFWFRYVDDVISCVPENRLPDILNEINSADTNIKLTGEVGNDKKYLDLAILRPEEGNLGFKIHRKPTHTDNYLNYDSCHPTSHKDSIIRSLVTRA
jgi:hypothetical protein